MATKPSHPIPLRASYQLPDVVKFILAIILFAVAILLLNKYFISQPRVDHRVIIEYIQSLQLPIIILLVYGLLRKYIPSLINREITAGPFAIGPPAQQQVNTDVDQSIKDSPKRFTAEDLKTPEGRKKILNDFAIKWELEKEYRSIYGTQIQALTALTVAIDRGLSQQELQPFFEQHKALLSTTPYRTVSDFLSYLTQENNSLVAFNQAANTYNITNIGLLFLQYLVEEEIALPGLRPF